MKPPAQHTPGPWKEAGGAILTADTSPANPRPCIALLSTAWRSEPLPLAFAAASLAAIILRTQCASPVRSQ